MPETVSDRFNRSAQDRLWDQVFARLDHFESALNAVREDISALRESRALLTGSARIGAWIADAGRMLAASVVGALFGWILMHHGIG